MTAQLKGLLNQITLEKNDAISAREREEISRRLSSNIRVILPFDGDFLPSWLLVDWRSPVWKTYAGKATRKVGDQWRGTIDVNWDLQLADGHRLIDPEYAVVLETCRRISCLHREGHLGGNAPAVSSWHVFQYDLTRLVRWLVLQEPRFEIRKYGLKMFDQNGLRELIFALGHQGWTGALSHIERAVAALYERAFNERCPAAYLSDPGHLPPVVRGKIIDWLDQNGGYRKSRFRGRKTVSRSFIATLISDIDNSGGSYRFNAVLRQFEPGWSHEHGLLLSEVSTEYPSHRISTIERALKESAGPSSVKQFAKSFQIICQAYRHLPDLLPDPACFNFRQAQTAGLKASSQEGATPYIPFQTGLRYLNEALRWVHLYGDDLVDYYLDVVKILLSELGDLGANDGAHRERIADGMEKAKLPTSLRNAGFRFDRLYPIDCVMDFDAFRREPTLQQALEVWLGAVVSLITILKPSRDSEIAGLKRACLIGEGPYWLDSDLAKRGVREHRAETGGRPIPTIVARAIQQLQRLGTGLATLYNEPDAFAKDQLFYVPTHILGIGTSATKVSLNQYLDCFCDYVGLPPDAMGRRWYLRIHEARKWFLLLLFWSGRYGVLDAARWIAGHTHVEHLYAYIEREFPYEVSKCESEFAADRLRQYDSTRVTFEGETGLNALYDRVLRHFDVESLELIPAGTWTDYIEQIRADGTFRIEPYTVFEESGDQRICIAFRSWEATDAN